MVRNPVMFVVEIGSVLTTVLWIQALGGSGRSARLVHRRRLALALVHGPLCELLRGAGRGAREGAGGGAAPGPARYDGEAAERNPSTDRQFETVSSASACSREMSFLVEAGDIIAADGEVIEGIASVDESAITGESAPVIRESGGDRSAVTGGTRVLSDWLVIRVTAEPGRRVPRQDDQAHRRREAPEDAERDRAQHSAGGLHDHLPGRLRDAPSVLALQRRGGRAGNARDDHRAGGPAGLPDSDDDRRTPLGDRHRRAWTG